MQRKLRIGTVAIAGAALALGSVGSAFAQDDVVVDYWTLTFDERRSGILNDIISDFEAANPGVKINMEQRGTDEHKDSLRVSAGTDAAPDIYFMWAGPGLGGEFVAAGLSADISDLWAERGWDDTFTAPAIANSQLYGGNHGVPYRALSQALVYKKDVFDRLGLEAPQTYDELLAVSDVLVENDIYPLSFGGTVNWHLMRLLDNLLEMRCGAEGHDALTNLEADWAESECALAAFEDLKMWSEKYIHPALMGIDHGESDQLFFAEQAALALQGDWFLSTILNAEENLDDYDFFPFPTGTGRLYSFGEMSYIGAGLDDATLQAAADFLDYLASPEVQEEYRGTFGAIPVVVGVGGAEEAPQISQDWAGMVEASEGVFMNGDQALPLDVTTEYWRVMNLVASSEMEAADAVVAMQEFIDNR